MPFTFTYKRGAADPVAFKPGSAALTLRSRAADQLDLGGMPAGTLQRGDVITVTFASAVRFRALVRRVSSAQSRGSAVSQSASALGPWHDLARLVYRQSWMLLPPAGEAAVPTLAARVILHQDAAGEPLTLAEQIADILGFAETPCGFAASASPSVPALTMPMEEQRDLTCAQALERCLRLLPHVCAAFDYSQTPPVLDLITPAASDAAWIAAASLLSREDTATGDPVEGVDLEIEATGSVNGSPYRQVVHQSAGDLSDPLRVLTATVQLAGSDSDATYNSADIVTETIPSDLTDASWWKAKHPRLANIAVGDIVITNPARSGSAEAANYPRITASAVSDIDAIGLKARVERFTCTAKITLASGGTPIDIEESVTLTMDFVTTNATTKKYKWMESSSSASGETIPEGLAAALLAQHAADGRETVIALRLAAEHWPAIGDTCSGLVASEISVDCRDETASVTFGPPGHLSPDEMADLLTGFRCRNRASHAYARSTGRHDDDKPEAEDRSVKPMSSTEFAPGQKAKTSVIADGKKVTLDPSADLGAGEEAKFRELKYTPEGGAETTVKILATEAVTIPPAGSDPDGIDVITSVKSFSVVTLSGGAGSALRITFGTANSITGAAGEDITKDVTLTEADLVDGLSLADNELTPSRKTVKTLGVADALPAAAIELPAGGAFPPDGWSEQTRVTQVQWDSTYYKLQIKKGTVLVKDDSEDAAWTDILEGEEFSV